MSKLAAWVDGHGGRVIWSLGIGALLVVLVRYALTFIETTHDWLVEGGVIVNDAALATFAAFVFHQLVVDTPERRRKRDVQELLAPRVDKLIGFGFRIEQTVNREAGLPPETSPVPDTAYADAFKNAIAGAPISGWATAWPQAITSVLSNAADQRLAIKPFYSVLDETVLAALEAEDHAARQLSGSLLVITAMSDGKWGDQNLRRLAEPVGTWLDTVNELRLLRSTKLAPWQPQPTLGPSDGMTVLPEDLRRGVFNLLTDYENDTTA